MITYEKSILVLGLSPTLSRSINNIKKKLLFQWTLVEQLNIKWPAENTQKRKFSYSFNSSYSSIPFQFTWALVCFFGVFVGYNQFLFFFDLSNPQTISSYLNPPYVYNHLRQQNRNNFRPFMGYEARMPLRKPNFGKAEEHSKDF